MAWPLAVWPRYCEILIVVGPNYYYSRALQFKLISASKRTVTCDFDDPYLCGYETPSPIGLSWKRKAASDTEDIGFKGPLTDGSGSVNGASLSLLFPLL